MMWRLGSCLGSRVVSQSVWGALLVGSLEACGAGSTLDDYSEGVPEVVPAPIKTIDAGAADAGAAGRDGGGDAGKDAGGAPDGGPGPGASTIGDPCTTTATCTGSGAQCLTNVSIVITTLVFPKGYCTQTPCTTDAQCPAGAGCLGVTQTCLEKCTRSTECRAADGYECAASPLGGGGSNYCLPVGIASLGGGGGATGALGGLLGGLFGGGTPGGGAN